MKLGKRQELFAECFGMLITYMYFKGYKVRIGDVWAKTGHIKNSNHYIKCAGDINLFKDGKYLTSTKAHAEFGAYWESLHPLCRWGGRYNDGNHYEVVGS